MEIAPGFTDDDWKRLLPSLDTKNPDCLAKCSPEVQAWDKAIDVFKTRIETRFIKPLDLLLKIHKEQKSDFENESDPDKKLSLDICRIRPGFATLTIDFVVIETLAGFRKGKIDHEGQSKSLIKSFLVNSWEFPEIDNYDIAESIYKEFRCQVAHKGQTDGKVIISDLGSKMLVVKDGCTSLNRTKFHEAVSKAFHKYCRDLYKPKNTWLRINFLKKMNSICGV